jgi:hypothetical protein
MSGLIPSGLPTTILYVFRFAPMPTTCLAHLIHLDLAILVVLGEEYELRMWRKILK